MAPRLGWVVLAGLFVSCWLAFPAAAHERGSPDAAALQVALRTQRLYGGPIDGVLGNRTRRAVVAFQQQKALLPDGVAGPLTRGLLGPLGVPDLGSRLLARGAMGWDVAELQFLLSWHGFPCGTFDGIFGSHTEAALRGYQRWAGLPPVGVAGRKTVASLAAPPPRSPIRLSPPVAAPIGDGFGPRGNRFHAGVDYPAPSSAPVAAGGDGRVVWAGPAAGGWGNLVVIAHGRGVSSLYAHLSQVDVGIGQSVAVGEQIGLVGETGRATGPNLHFEVRVRGAAVDPRGALG